jgi:glycosyltransferase involved in cell wall biosynthesis
MGTELPRLAYVGDPPVGRRMAGSLLLYRLLKGYDPSRLFVVESNMWPPAPGTGLPGVKATTLRYVPRRLFRTRFNPYFSLAFTRLAPLLTARVVELLRRFRAEAVLTVAECYLWRAAAAAARACRLPLHLIVHDDWPSFNPGPPYARTYYDRVFARWYRAATDRLCVSPFMAEAYQGRYGAPGTVLYPTRGEDSPPPRVRLRPESAGGFVVAYAGSLTASEYNLMLGRVAEALQPSGGCLDIYGQLTAAWQSRAGLGLENVRAHGYLPPAELAETLGRTADALIVPMSFAPAERHTVSTAFPSKLADYTAIGLPILIWGPTYSSAVRWADHFRGAAEVVTTRDPRHLAAALVRLAADRRYRFALAARAVEVGEQCFSLDRGRAILSDSLRRGAAPADSTSPAPGASAHLHVAPRNDKQ